ncbi:bifunctional DNA-formamidopyrimidine glycosylase/DNA-(apurinic or apyrimidinic site) lyase [Plantibacter sp. ME-Dv--P-095]|uniref:bifunctional DNA-formamidopyrimidine glycosylase/DNA-(apurinic or apyrimidinic site) lyase n=1 Tax=Plantibacter sp. ME-Dv--P-095 TaxID=3040299 RepID=UPI00254EB5D0|nr:bifunctional DNA-formamidopyrimidine glycosylase/DNA-(apurinic or apyrimidinic site) lyase [Plantibacter sp. ME-Dv--P-095]
MPELPEVEVVRAGLEPAVSGSTVAGVEVFDERSLRRHASGVADFTARLTGRTIRSAVRRGKFLWFPLDDQEAIVGHLGMSGQMLLRSPGDDADRLLRIRLQLEHPEHGELWLHFVDQRIFGSMAVTALVPTSDGAAGGFGDDVALVPDQVSHIARDPMDPAFDDAVFLRRLREKRTGVKRALLDQTLVSGIGNIYADESLWAARIHPEQETARLSRPRAARLLDEVRQVLAKALAEGGTSFDAQYVNVNGQAGYFAHSLNAYGRQGKPCARCGTFIVREQFMNRGSHRCPVCQRRT